MIRFYHSTAPNPAKITLFLEESEMPYELVSVDQAGGEQKSAEFLRINPNGQLPAIVDTDGSNGRRVRVFDTTAILLYLAGKIDRFLGATEDRAELLSWLMWTATGLSPFAAQAAYFQRVSPAGGDHAIERFRREAERLFGVLDGQLAENPYIAGESYTIVDMAAWAWVDRAPNVLPGAENPLIAFPHVDRWKNKVDARPAVARARSVAAG